MASKPKQLPPAVKAALKALARDRILVGIPSEKAFRAPDPNDPHPHLNNAEVGYLNEFGDPASNLPARPHLVPGVRRALPEIRRLYRSALVAALRGNKQGVRDIETKIGFAATSSVKNLITNVLAPPLSERTIEERARRGRTGETPLLDTGQYLRNIDFVVAPAENVKKRGK